ncbi:tRNA lysidine(34) synthetase TilS [Wolbachia endosymbiont of Brugia malayi]|uniref:tRNA(Ile)-lysidine synthase n=1 Tax=Wolbachia sp. subsp. Brugia malayi (strain TRS) TaxID=292805 RepID=TILS_WOLTR|nr:tRNA lysidine(34) synthetase TilS [Wolbachia endosymbiont of Brugia malayi]Q5GTD2.1 RecName: Full=tRNA(Ile)-lysidine synthase; AltName: Full=tRNA(Ile)-2-lysyl-cytidine synthase; AltName: Full=tRNA(Ile)-lysidine synthetase [Wolbachia endosymbiont strain TRS of Brugia malayi]AAW70742.1 Predicted ATPase of the PP-loop superfamily implicated in cell cycle control, MesJ [Wolbachia endosymbiont strain TRS of Brugia malayi]QCB61720.1 tRNA lysidine(34) synthetase TilS [Wolbachia endosymbiont of Brugi
MELESLFQDIMDGFAVYNNKVAVAVSGGIDSIVLLHLITSWAEKRQCPPPIALAVNHGLRPESQEEVEFVVSYAKELGVKKSFILNWKRQNIKGNVQSQARKARYELLTEWCKNNDVKHLFIAHHKDDQAETFLLRLERGSGLDGLSSMDYKSSLNGVCMLRPLLSFSRSRIKKYADFYRLKWVEDRSNQSLKYKRTLYRNLLKASGNQEILTERICLTTLHIKRATKALMHYTRLAFNDCVNVHDLGYIEIKLSEFYKLPEEIALRLLLYSIMVISSKHYKPRYNSLIAIFNKVLQKDNDVHCTLSGCKIRKYGESILIIRESSKIQEISVSLPLNAPIEWDNRFSCTILGNQECSVTIAPLKKTQKIPKFLKDYDCCPEVFYSLPVVLKDGKVLAYLHLNHDRKNINGDEVQCIINSTIKQNLVILAGI